MMLHNVLFFIQWHTYIFSIIRVHKNVEIWLNQRFKLNYIQMCLYSSMTCKCLRLNYRTYKCFMWYFTSQIFRNCRVSGSERIVRCPSASEPRTGSHKSAVYWGYHGLHGEWWRLCHKIRQVVWHSSQCVTRWWVENSVLPETNMYAYWSSPKMGDDCHWCDDIELCSWSGRGSWWDAMQYTRRVAL